MLSFDTFLKKISYKEMVAALVNVMAENFEDFSANQIRFAKTISWLENSLERHASPSAEETVKSIEQQIGTVVLFSFFLGLKANLDHYIDPIGRTFLEVDAETYLRENVAKRLPACQNAQLVQEQFYSRLTPVQQERFEDVTAYICHLETVGPKLAHYYGYMLGNELFPCIIPGYGVDLQLTFQYKRMLESYFGISLTHNFDENIAEDDKRCSN